MTRHILVVDDEPDLDLLVKQKFQKRTASGEFQFSFARDGEQAVNMIGANTDIELVVTDINMPGMDGLELLAKIGAMPRLLKTVIVSAYDDMDNIRTAMNRGAYDFLTKPIDFADLEITLDKTLRELDLLRKGLEAREQLSVLDYELAIAMKIQKSILPEILTGRSEFEISATMLPARQVSGDFYDFFMIDANRLGLVIGDVSGKGIPAALFMAVSRTVLRAIALRGVPPDECLDEVNRILLKQSNGEVFLTLFYGILDLDSGDFRYSAAAQTPPYLFHPDQPGKFLSEPRGMMLGLLDEATYQNGYIQLQPGDGLLLYTDGVTEVENSRHEFLSTTQLKQAIERVKGENAANVIAGVLSTIAKYTDKRPQADDITVLACRFRPH